MTVTESSPVVDLVDRTRARTASLIVIAVFFGVAALLAGLGVLQKGPAGWILFAACVGIGALFAWGLLRGLPRLLVDDDGIRLSNMFGTTVRRWADLGPFAPERRGVATTWRGPGGVERWQVPAVVDSVWLAAELNRRHDRARRAG